MPDRPSPDAVRAHYAAVPAPLVAATGIVLDTRGRVLVLTTSYKTDLELPGGMVEDTETPEERLARELREELGLTLPAGRLLAVDSRPPGPLGRSLVVHVHLVGPLPPQEAAAITFPDGEITEARWLTPDEAAAALPERIAPGCAPPWPPCTPAPSPTSSTACPSRAPRPGWTRRGAWPWSTRAPWTRPATGPAAPRP